MSKFIGSSGGWWSDPPQRVGQGSMAPGRLLLGPLAAIPKTEVKPYSPDGTARASGWESKVLLELNREPSGEPEGFFVGKGEDFRLEIGEVRWVWGGCVWGMIEGRGVFTMLTSGEAAHRSRGGSSSNSCRALRSSRRDSRRCSRLAGGGWPGCGTMPGNAGELPRRESRLRQTCTPAAKLTGRGNGRPYSRTDRGLPRPLAG